MRIVTTLVFCAVIALSLASCASGPRRQINPPKASLQELHVQASGQWQLQLRLQNFSNVSTTFATVDATLVVDGQEAGKVILTPAISIGPASADVVIASLTPAIAAKTSVATALATGRTLRYVLSGKITSSKPKGDYNFTFESTLNPAPGLPGVMR